MIRAGLVVLLLVFSQQIHAEETPHFAFVAEYVRELGANEAARATGERELAEKGANSLAAGIRVSTRIMLELRSQIGLLKNMSLKPPFEELPANLSKFYAIKIERHERLVEISSVILSGPQPGVDYGTLAAEASKITAELEFIDQSLFKATPLIFATLIAPNPDKNGHMSRLIITTAERWRLLRELTGAFGKKLDQDDQNYIISSASVLKAYLEKDYKCADEPE